MTKSVSLIIFSLAAILYPIVENQPLQSAKLSAFPENYQKKRLIISTDIGGGDKDDTQSMIHFLAYSNMFDVEGIVISRPKGHIREMSEVIKAYRKDYKKFRLVSENYITPNQLKKITKVGAERLKKSPRQGYSNSTPGSRLIVNAGRKDDPRPLYVLSWGSLTDVAQALHDAPDIHKKLIIVSGGSEHRGAYNYAGDPNSYDYVHNIRNKKFKLFRSVGSGEAMFITGLNAGKYSNKGFVKRVIRPNGHLGKLYYSVSYFINTGRYSIKMGDTVTLLFVFNGSIEKPSKKSWGGRFCKVEKNYYKICDKDLYKSWYKSSNRIIDAFRVDILKDWESRINSIYKDTPIMIN